MSEQALRKVKSEHEGHPGRAHERHIYAMTQSTSVGCAGAAAEIDGHHVPPPPATRWGRGRGSVAVGSHVVFRRSEIRDLEADLPDCCPGQSILSTLLQPALQFKVAAARRFPVVSRQTERAP